MAIPQWSVTKRKEATNVFSAFLVVCNKTSLQKRFGDAPSLLCSNQLSTILVYSLSARDNPVEAAAGIRLQFQQQLQRGRTQPLLVLT